MAKSKNVSANGSARKEVSKPEKITKDKKEKNTGGDAVGEGKNTRGKATREEKDKKPSSGSPKPLPKAGKTDIKGAPGSYSAKHSGKQTSDLQKSTSPKKGAKSTDNGVATSSKSKPPTGAGTVSTGTGPGTTGSGAATPFASDASTGSTASATGSGAVTPIASNSSAVESLLADDFESSTPALPVNSFVEPLNIFDNKDATDIADSTLSRESTNFLDPTGRKLKPPWMTPGTRPVVSAAACEDVLVKP